MESEVKMKNSRKNVNEIILLKETNWFLSKTMAKRLKNIAFQQLVNRKCRICVIIFSP